MSLLEWCNANIESVLTALSILIALVTWLVKAKMDDRARRIDHTANAIALLSTCDRLAESNFRLTQIINLGEDISCDEVDAETERAVIDILNYYEYLCTLYERNVYDRDTITHLRGGLIRLTYERCQRYIKEVRARQNRPELYEKFEELALDLQAKYGRNQALDG